jgi:hypothetical protein
MSWLPYCLAAGLMLCGSQISEAQTRQPKGYHDHPLRADGIGVFSVGMTLDEMKHASGLNFEIDIFDPDDTDPPPPLENNSCYYVTPLGVADEIAFMMSYGRMVRIDTYESLVKTARGVGVGDRDIDILGCLQIRQSSIGTAFLRWRSWTLPDCTFAT